MQEFLKDWGAPAASLVSIFTLLAFIARPIRKFIKSHVEADKASKLAFEQHIALDSVNAEAVAKRLETLERHSVEAYKRDLWAEMRDKELSLKERAAAAQKYADAGYNGVRLEVAKGLMQQRAKELMEEERSG